VPSAAPGDGDETPEPGDGDETPEPGDGDGEETPEPGDGSPEDDPNGQPDPVCRDDAQENNDTADAAVPLLPGDFDGMVACPEDEDWFLVRLEAGSTARVDLEFDILAGRLQVALLDRVGATVARADGDFGRRTLEFTAPEDGDYRLVVLPEVEAVGLAYRLSYVLVPAPDPCAGEDPLEDNDDLASAAALGQGRFGGLFACAGDEDWFRFPACAGGQIDIELGFSHADSDLDLHLVDSDGAVLFRSETDDDGEQVRFEVEAAADYMIRVHAADGGAHYSLTIEVSGCAAGPRDDVLEDNDTQETATAVAAGRHWGLVAGQDDPDWFSTEVCAGGRLSATVDHEDGDVEVRIVDAEGVEVAVGHSEAGSSDASAQVGDEGTLWVLVDVAGDEPVDYELTLTVTECAVPIPDDGFEPNDSRDAGSRVMPGRFGGLVSAPDNEDWYVVEGCAGGFMLAEIEFRNDDGDLALHVLGPDGNVLGASNGSLAFEAVVLEMPAAGDYLVRVLSADGDRAVRYGMTLLVDCAEEVVDDEPDDGADDGADDGETVEQAPPVDNTSPEAAAPVEPGVHDGLALPAGLEHWYVVSVPAGTLLSVLLDFRHEDGDLDLAVYDAAGTRIALSASATDGEAAQVVAAVDTTVLVRVYGYQGASNSYVLTILLQDAPE